MESQLRFTISLAILLAGCSESSSVVGPPSTKPGATERESGGPESWGGLRVQFSGARLADAQQAIVMLHGYGASGSDLMPLADYIGGESRAFVFPEGPFPLWDGGKAWATKEGELDTSRSRIIDLLNEIAKAHPNLRISVGGFSQGATIASTLLTDDHLQLEHLFLYAPAFVLDEVAPPSNRRTRVLISHGRADDRLPFSDSERLRDLLMREGYDVNWQPFDGGHTITREGVDATRIQLNDTAKQ